MLRHPEVWTSCPQDMAFSVTYFISVDMQYPTPMLGISDSLDPSLLLCFKWPITIAGSVQANGSV